MIKEDYEFEAELERSKLCASLVQYLKTMGTRTMVEWWS
jgi:hypothetical protein